MKLLFKYSFGFLLLLGGLLSVSYLQKKFDDGDGKKAVNAVRSKFPDVADCRYEITSRFRGLVDVRCREQGQEWIWTVDVVHAFISSRRSPSSF
jgi:hypothetical protein